MLRHLRYSPIGPKIMLPALGVLGIALSLALLNGCGSRSAEAVVTRRDIVAHIRADGKVVAPASARADIMAPYEVPVDQIYVTVGENVRRGETLLLFSAPQNQAYYQQARAALLQAQRSLAQAQKSFGADLKAAQQRLAQSRAAERQARTASATPPSPDETGAGPSPSSTPAAMGAGALTARRQADEQAVIDAQARMSEGLVPYQQAVASAQQQFESAQAGSKAGQLKSPISGTVLAINTSIGKTPDVQSKKPLMTVVDLSALHVAAGIDENQLRRLKPGDPAIVTVTEVPNVRFSGSMAQVYSQKAGFLQGQQYVAIVDFRNVRGQAKPDMDAAASIETGRVADALAVPANAIMKIDHQRAVKLREGRRWRQRIVETGLSDGRYTEIVSGLSEGDIVQTNP